MGAEKLDASWPQLQLHELRAMMSEGGYIVKRGFWPENGADKSRGNGRHAGPVTKKVKV